MDTKTLWHIWREYFCCDDRAIALAINIGNKKIKQETDKYKINKFYVIKDEFIRRNDQNIVRYEKTTWRRECTKCKDMDDEEVCPYCYGMGYTTFDIYECQMVVGGLHFGLHSHLSPEEFTTKVRTTGDEHPHFHSSDKLPDLSVEDLLKLLSYVVWYIWGLDFDYSDTYPKISYEIS